MLAHEIMADIPENDIAFIEGDQQTTYGGLKQAIGFCRNRLYAAGIRRGDRVAICSRNSANFVFAYLGIVSLGAVVVPINFQLTPREMAYILQNAEVHHIFSDKPLDLDEEMTDYAGGLAMFDIVNVGIDSGAPEASIVADLKESDLAAIIYTSGTTGFPKGAVLSHKNLVSNALQYREILQLTEKDRSLCVLPLYHCFSWTCNIMGILSCGASTVILDSFAPKEAVEIISKQQVNVLFVVPSICALLTKFATVEVMKQITLTIIGGTALPEKIAQDYKAKFGLEILEGYGLSECSPVVAVNPPGRSIAGSIGLPLCETQVKTVRQDGTDAAPNEPGELLIKSPSVMQGYWKLPEETKKALEGGWLHTGDVAKIDENGYIYIVDRIKDMIISMGENIYPREIEELVYHYPGIKEAAVIGIEDRLRGQAGCLYYCVQDGETVELAALKKYLRQNLATYKVPREFRQIDELPKTSTGKPAKKALAAMFEMEKDMRSE